MGMYTRFGFKAKVSPKHFDYVKSNLDNQDLIGRENFIINFKFFEKESLWEITIRSQDDYKNYYKEAERFMTWITPFVEPQPEPIAAQWYENWPMPFLYYYKSGAGQ